MSKNLLTMKEYAEHRGLTPGRISQLINEGMLSTVIKNGKKYLDKNKADKEFDSRVDASKRNANHNQTVKARKPYETENNKKEVIPDIYNSKAIKEAFAARLAKLEYEEKAGQVIRIDKVKIEAFNVARQLRNALLNIAPKIATELAALTDPHEVEMLLDREIREALIELSRGKYIEGSL